MTTARECVCGRTLLCAPLPLRHPPKARYLGLDLLLTWSGGSLDGPTPRREEESETKISPSLALIFFQTLAPVSPAHAAASAKSAVTEVDSMLAVMKARGVDAPSIKIAADVRGGEARRATSARSLLRARQPDPFSSPRATNTRSLFSLSPSILIPSLRNPSCARTRAARNGLFPSRPPPASRTPWSPWAARCRRASRSRLRRSPPRARPLWPSRARHPRPPSRP